MQMHAFVFEAGMSIFVTKKWKEKGHGRLKGLTVPSNDGAIHGMVKRNLDSRYVEMERTQIAQSTFQKKVIV